MGSVLLRGEILSFLSTTIWKDLDEVLTWEIRNLGQVSHIIYQYFYCETNTNKQRGLILVQIKTSSGINLKTGVMTFQQNFLRFENRRIWVAGVRLKVVPYPVLRYTKVHCAPWNRVCNESPSVEGAITRCDP